MNEQDFDENTNPLDSVDKDPGNPAYDRESSRSETVTSVGVVNRELITDEIPMYETPIKDMPMTGTPPKNDWRDETIPDNTQTSMPAESFAPLLSQEDAEHFRTHWNEIQGRFVDDPRIAVQQADALVAEVITQIIQGFGKEHTALENRWKQGNDVSTEDLRKVLQSYRSFFKRLVV